VKEERNTSELQVCYDVMALLGRILHLVSTKYYILGTKVTVLTSSTLVSESTPSSISAPVWRKKIMVVSQARHSRVWCMKLGECQLENLQNWCWGWPRRMNLKHGLNNLSSLYHHDDPHP